MGVVILPTLSILVSLFVLMLLAPTMSWVVANFLKQGSSLSVEKESDFLVSPNGSFSSGFYKIGTNAYCYSIWFTNSSNKTVVWMANRDHPVNGKQSKLTLHSNGNLMLTDADGSTIWSTETFSDAHVRLQLLETGNLVITNQADDMIIWESFDYPTDTLLPTQPLTKNKTLVSMRSRGTYLTGYFNFHFGDDNILDLIYNGPTVSSLYWPNTTYTVFLNGRTPYNSSRVAILDEQGQFTSSDSLTFSASDYSLGPKRRLTLDYDGILRLYSLDDSTGLWAISWFSSNIHSCRVHGLCGENGICFYNPLPTCTCPRGFYMKDPSDWSKGCSPRFNLTCNPVELDFMEIHSTDYDGYDIGTFVTGVAIEVCRNACLNDCSCKGFVYKTTGSGQCYRKGILLNGFQMTSSPTTMHIKIPIGLPLFNHEIDLKQLNKSNLVCSDRDVVFGNEDIGGGPNKYRYTKYVIGFVGAVGIVEMICIGLGWWFVHERHSRVEVFDMGYIALAMGFKRFTFAELKTATRNFKQEIGKGGFGRVYKGVLNNGTLVAVKRLEGILQGDAEFWAEVSIIGRINHMNLVKMWGFCAEDKHKLLVYEYLENGSLDKILFLDSSTGGLGWDHRYNIALGTARGLSYLHEECLEWVLHCDVKPQNILLDEHLRPKVTDFGMSKLVKNNSHNMGFSRVRGTRGYLAPEWMMNLEINAKADVYSYGIVLLELVSGKSASDFRFQVDSQENECNHLVQWVREKVKQGEIWEAVDPRLNGVYNMEKVERLVQVGLWCVGEDRDTRPSMSKIVEVLMGDDKETSTEEEMDE